MKILTQDLTGSALDWAVALCEGRHLAVDGYGDLYCPVSDDPWHYSTDLAQGAPIIEREMINYIEGESTSWDAWIGDTEDDDCVMVNGPTPLIAAMRCYVAMKLGYEVEVPEELAA